MQFFSDSLSQFNKGYSSLFGIVDEEENEEGEEPGGKEKTDRDSEETTPNSFSAKWGWIHAVDEVSETTRESWETVFKMNIVEFLNILSYIRDKAAEEKRKMEEYKRSIKK